MSANLLQYPGKMHTLTDDLESFLHVLSWMMLRYVPAKDFYTAKRRGKDLSIFDEYYPEEGQGEEGGDDKARAFRAEDYPSPRFRPRCDTPLFDLLQDLSKPFKSLYGKHPRDAWSKRNHKAKLEDLIRQHESDIKCLQSATWFINEIKRALDEEPWPTNDAANVNLPIASANQTDRQMQLHTSQLQYTQSQWAMSKAPSMNSKRARSPTPESSVKRRRSTPDASGSGT